MQIKPVRIALIASAAAVGLSASAGAFAAVDVFIKFAGIEGESSHQDHKGSSDVIAFSWGAASTANGKKGCISDLVLTKNFDKASPQLITNAATGATIPTAELFMRKAGEGQKDFLKITMTNVKVSSYHASNGYSDTIDQVSLSFETMSGSYKAQDDKGGLGGETLWSIGPNPGKCQ